MLVKFKCIQSSFLRPASFTDGAIYACSIIVAPQYATPHLHALCNMQQLGKGLPLCNCTQAWQHGQQSSDSAFEFCAHQVGVLWNSSYSWNKVRVPLAVCVSVSWLQRLLCPLNWSPSLHSVEYRKTVTPVYSCPPPPLMMPLLDSEFSVI